MGLAMEDVQVSVVSLQIGMVCSIEDTRLGEWHYRYQKCRGRMPRESEGLARVPIAYEATPNHE